MCASSSPRANAASSSAPWPCSVAIGTQIILDIFYSIDFASIVFVFVRRPSSERCDCASRPSPTISIPRASDSPPPSDHRTHSRRRSIDPASERGFSKLCKNFLNAFPQRPSHASVPWSRRRARDYECRLSMRSRRGKRSSRNERISTVESLSDFRGYEPSMDLKISQRQLEM